MPKPKPVKNSPDLPAGYVRVKVLRVIILDKPYEPGDRLIMHGTQAAKEAACGTVEIIPAKPPKTEKTKKPKS